MKKTRLTAQRIKVLDYLNRVKRHPTADMVYKEVVKELPSITLATVYRNLNLLAERGDILRLRISNEYRYDGDTSTHQHCVCRKCGGILDIFQKEISQYALKKFSCKGFDPDSLSIIFYGTCKNCKKTAQRQKHTR